MAYDIITRNYNDHDHALKQFDLVAVKEEGFFRTAAAYRRFKHAEVDLSIDHRIEGKLSKRDEVRRRLERDDPTPTG